MFSTYQTSGFYCAPVTKGLIMFVILLSVTFNVPLSAFRSYFQITSHVVFELLQLDKYLASRFVFLDPRDVLCFCILLYQFRIFERRYGSTKFMSFILATLSLSMMFELLAIYLLELIDVQLSVIPTGPWGPVFALCVPYFCDIPRVAVTHLWGIPFTGKSITYIIALQMMSTSSESLLLAFCGVLSGMVYRKDILMMQSWLRVPKAVSSLANYTLGRMLHTPCPPDLQKPIGATVEIQRTLYMEEMEQQLIQSRMAAFHDQTSSSSFNAFRFLSQARQQASVQVRQPSEEQINFLVGMGFSRERAIEALRVSNNDLSSATTVLLNSGH